MLAHVLVEASILCQGLTSMFYIAFLLGGENGIYLKSRLEERSLSPSHVVL